MEALGVDLMSPVATDHLLLSGGDELRVLPLLVEDRGEGSAVGGWVLFAKCESMMERKNRFALSRGPASFSEM